MSDQRAAESEDRWRIRSAVFQRDRNRCRLDPSSPFYPAALRHPNAGGDKVGACMGPLTPHHLRKASAAGPYTENNLVALCAGHNTWVEDFPLTATALGLVIR